MHPHGKRHKHLRILIPILMLLGLALLFIFKHFFYVPAFVLRTDDLRMEDLRAQNLPVILVFGRDGDAESAQIYDALAQFAPEMRGRVCIRYIDVESNPRTAEQFDPISIPCSFFYTSDGSAYAPSDAVQRMGLEFTLVTEQGAHTQTVCRGALTEARLHMILEDME